MGKAQAKVRVSKYGGVTLVAAVMLTNLTVSASEPTGGGASAGYWLEEVMITAQKREQSSLDVGISVSVVDENAIREARISEVTDIVLFTSNTSIKDTIPGLMPVITIRGVGLNDYNAANNPSAGVYVDEVSLSSLALMSSGFIDLASVEILKGPQGILYGRNSTAGAINFNTAKPHFDSFEARLSTGGGNYGMTELDVMVNAPINEEFTLRFAAKGLNQSRGYWDNRTTGKEVGDREEVTVRLQGLWEPLDTDLSLLLKMEGHQGRSELGSPEFFGALPTRESVDCPGSKKCSNFLGYTDNDNDPFQGDWSADPSYNKDQLAATLRIEYQLDIGTLTSVSGFIDFDRSYSADTDASPIALTDFYFRDSVRQYSEELRLSGDVQELLEWQVGLFYAVDQVDARTDAQLGLLNTSTATSAEQEAISRAIFANFDWALSESLTLVSGIRFSRESKHAEVYTQDLVSEVPFSFVTLAPFGSPPITLASIDREVEDSSIAWKLGLNWRTDETTLLYASLSQGNKSGGFFSGIASSSAQYEPYDTETLRSLEMGVKGRSSETGLAYELGVFYYDYNDTQTFIQDNSGAVPVQRLNNVDGASIYGVDASLKFYPSAIPDLSFSGSMGYLITEMNEFIGAEGIIPKGNELPDSPEISFQLGAVYEIDFSDSVSGTLAIDGRYQASTFRDALNDPLLQSESYWVVNARSSFTINDGMEFSIWVKNLVDEQYVTQGFNQLTFGNGYRVYGSPRTYGLTLSKHFN